MRKSAKTVPTDATRNVGFWLASQNRREQASRREKHYPAQNEHEITHDRVRVRGYPQDPDPEVAGPGGVAPRGPTPLFFPVVAKAWGPPPGDPVPKILRVR